MARCHACHAFFWGEQINYQSPLARVSSGGDFPREASALPIDWAPRGPEILGCEGLCIYVSCYFLIMATRVPGVCFGAGGTQGVL